MAHELSSANLRRVVPGWVQKLQPGGVFGLPLLRDEERDWSLILWRLRRGKRDIHLRCEVSVLAFGVPTAWLPLGTISTVAELREWYIKLGGKGWE